MADDKERLNNSLQCHVCFEDYKIDQRIWQCRSGHSICAPCRSHLNECPFCKAPYEGTRNYAIEDIVRELKGSNSSDRTDSDNVLPIQPTAPADDNVILSDVLPTAAAADENDISHDEHRHMQLPPSIENDYTDSSSSSDSDMVMVEFPRPTRRSNTNPWIRCTSDEIPWNAIVGGRDHGNTPLYVGRAVHGDALIPGKVNPEYGTCYIPYDGDEIEKSHFEILANISGAWLPNSGGTIPMDAFAAGHSENGEILYIGRAHVEGTLAIGKVVPSFGCCFVSYGGQEFSRQDYEIFVLHN